MPGVVSIPLESLSNVSITSTPSDGDTLTFVAASGTYQMKAAKGGSGGVTIEQVDDHLAEAFVPGIGIEITYDDDNGTFTFDRLETLTAHADASTITFDLSAGEHKETVLGGNRTLAVSSPVIGQKFRVKLTQDATGGRTVTWFSGITWADGYVPALTTVPGDHDVFEFLVTNTGSYGNAFLGWVLTAHRPKILTATLTPDASASIATTTQGGVALVEVWKLDEAGTTDDRQGSLDVSDFTSCNNPTLSGADGADITWGGLVSVIETTLVSGLGFTATAPRSISGWFKSQSVSSGVVMEWVCGSHSLQILKTNNSGSTRYQAKATTSAGPQTVNWSANSTDNAWHLVVARWDGTNLGLSVDGANFVTAALGGNMTTGAAKVLLASGGEGTLETDEVALWSEAMSNSTALFLWASGVGEFFPYSGTSEVHTLTVTGTPTSGTIELTILGEAVTLNYDDTAAEAKTAINAVLGAGSVDVTGGPLPGTALAIEFTGAYAGINVASSSVDDSGLAGGITIDWSAYDVANLTVDGSSGNHTITNASIVAGKRLHVSIENDGGSGTITWAGVDVAWGTAGAPDMPPDTETFDLELLATSVTRIAGSVVGEAGSSDGTGNTFEAENKSGATLAVGAVVAPHSSGTGTIKAIATAYGTLAIGLARASTANGVSGVVQTTGPFTMSDWTSIAGATELTARAKYYLSPTTAGTITTTCPTTGGHVIQLVGVAVSPTTLDLDPGDGIQL